MMILITSWLQYEQLASCQPAQSWFLHNNFGWGRPERGRHGRALCLVNIGPQQHFQKMTHMAPGPPLLTKDGGPGHFGITVCQSKQQSCACGRFMLIGNKKTCVQGECWGSIPTYSHPGVSLMKELLTDQQILEKAMKKAEFFKKRNVHNAVKSTPDKSPTEYSHNVDPAKNEDKSPFSTSTIGTERQNLNRSPNYISLQQEPFLLINKNMDYLKDPGDCVVQFSPEEDKSAKLLDAGKDENLCTLQGNCGTDVKTELQQPSDEGTDTHPVDDFQISQVLPVEEARRVYDCVKNAKRLVVLTSIKQPQYECISDDENPVDTNVVSKATEAQSYLMHTDIILEENRTLDSQSDPCVSAKLPHQYAGPGSRSNEQALLNIKAPVPSMSIRKTENCSPEQPCRCPVLVETEVGFEEQLCTNCQVKMAFPADESTQIMDLTTGAMDNNDYDNDDWLAFPVVISDLRFEPRDETPVTAEAGVTAHNYKDTMSDASARTSPSFEIDSEKDSIPQIGKVSSSCDPDASCDNPASSVDNYLTASILCVDKDKRLENRGIDVKLKRTLSGSADDTPARKIQKPRLSLDSHMTCMQVPQSKLQDTSKTETLIKAVRQVQKRQSFVLNNLRERTGISPPKNPLYTVPVSDHCRNDKKIQPSMEPERNSVLHKHGDRKESNPERLQLSVQNSLNSSDCDQALTSTIYNQRNDCPETSKVHIKTHQKNTAKKAQLKVQKQSDLKELRKQIPLSKPIPGKTNMASIVGQKALVKSASITRHHPKQGSTSKREIPLSSADGSHLATPSQKRGSPFLSKHSSQLGEQSFQQDTLLSPRESLSHCDRSNLSEGHVSQCRKDSASSPKYVSASVTSVTITNSVLQQVRKNWSESFVPTPNPSKKKKMVQFETSSHRSQKKPAKEHYGTGKKFVNEPSKQRYNSKTSQMMKETKRQATEWRKATHRNRDAPYNQKSAVGQGYDVDEGYEGRTDKGKRLTPKGICREEMRRYFKSI